MRNFVVNQLSRLARWLVQFLTPEQVRRLRDEIERDRKKRDS